MKVKIRLSDEFLKVYGKDATKSAGGKRRTKNADIEEIKKSKLPYLEGKTFKTHVVDPTTKKRVASRLPLLKVEVIKEKKEAVKPTEGK
jgi:hypothetical protein